MDRRIKEGLNASFVEANCETIELTKKELDEYLSLRRRYFTVPFITVGTLFQKEVWAALTEVEYGKTASYLDLAKSINNPKAVRSVAAANGANALALIIPCHSIINSNGNLGGYGGGLSVKKKLLQIEKNIF